MKIAILGAGNVGLAFAELLHGQGHHVRLGSRDPAQFKQTLLEIMPLHSLDFTICDYTAALKNAELTLLAVPDDSIQSVCRSIAEHLQPNSVIAHFAGALDSSELGAAHERGLLCCSLHPLNSFPSLEASLALFQPQHASYLFCEGQAAALHLTDRLFKQCGFVPIKIAASAKPLYHAASVFACNYLSVLMDASMQAATAAGLDEKIMWQALQPLIQTTLNNIGEKGPVKSLSGPVSRGDQHTIRKHRAALNEVSPALSELYAQLGMRAVDLIKRRDTLSPASIDKLIDALKS